MTAPTALRIVIVAGVRLYREGMANSLARRDGFHVAGVASSLDEAVPLVTSAEPDVVVLDMATEDSYEIARALRARASAIKTVAFAVANCEREIQACAEAGIAGYVSADASMDELVGAIEGVARGDLPVPPGIAAALFRHLTVRRNPARESSRLPLTARERQVLRLIEEDLSNKEIAAHLNIEVATVKNHVHSLLTKMHVASRGQAVARLTSSGSGRRDRWFWQQRRSEG
jgi:two-component system nitrate/nitrite response regulator NarL